MRVNGEHARARASGERSRIVSRRGFLAATGAGAAVSMTGCLGGGGGGGESVKIGGVYLLSGLAEALGSGSEASAEVAVDAINEDGGIMDQDVQLQIRDHGDDPQSQIRSLVQEWGADVMIGLTSSGVTLSSGPTIEQLGVPFTLTDIGTPYATEFDTETYGDYHESDDGKAAQVPNLFRANSNTSHMTYSLAKYAHEEMDVSRVANMGPNYAYGQQCWEYFKAYSEGLGADYEYVASEFPELGASDMTPQINSVLDADPELVFTSFWAGDTVTFVNQAVEQGLFEQVDDVFDTIGADPNNFQALGDTMPDGYHFSAWYYPSAYDNEYNQAFVDRFRETFADDSSTLEYPPFTGGSTWSAVQIYRDAIEAAGSTNPDDIISQMEGYTFEEDPRGPVTIDAESHQANAPTVIGETSHDVDVPYEGASLANTQTYTVERSTASDLLEGSGLPPGM